MMKNANSDVLHSKPIKVCRMKEIDCNTCPHPPQLTLEYKLFIPYLASTIVFVFLAIFEIAEWTIIVVFSLLCAEMSYTAVGEII